MIATTKSIDGRTRTDVQKGTETEVVTETRIEAGRIMMTRAEGEKRTGADMIKRSIVDGKMNEVRATREATIDETYLCILRIQLRVPRLGGTNASQMGIKYSFPT